MGIIPTECQNQCILYISSPVVHSRKYYKPVVQRSAWELQFPRDFLMHDCYWRVSCSSLLLLITYPHIKQTHFPSLSRNTCTYTHSTDTISMFSRFFGKKQDPYDQVMDILEYCLFDSFMMYIRLSTCRWRRRQLRHRPDIWIRISKRVCRRLPMYLLFLCVLFS